jgi:large-conductance mechanosensitive channel
MIQIIITYLIICFAIVYTIVGLYNSVKKKTNKCGGNCNCDLKRKINS